MATATATVALVAESPANPPTPAVQPYRVSLDLYLKIAELGLIRPEEHVVLLDETLVQTMTKGHEHINAVDRGEEALKAVLPPGWLVRDEDPIALREGPMGASAPEPDLVVLFGTRERYDSRLPEAADVALIVEIASTVTAFATDRQGLARYAFAQIPTVWIVTPHDRRVHIFTEPSGPGPAPAYARVEVKQVGDPLDAQLVAPEPDQPPARLGPVAVAAFFPPNL